MAYFSTCLQILLLSVMFLPLLSHGQSCTPATAETPSDILGLFYYENSEVTDRIAPEETLADPKQRLFVHGKVIDRNTCEGIPNIIVETWYAGAIPNGEGVYQRYEHRGRTLTDALGGYNFTQAFPGKVPSRPLIHVHYRLSKFVIGDEILVTQMYFYGNGSGYSLDRSNVQVIETTRDTYGARQAEFNFFIDRSSNDGSGEDSFFRRFIAFVTSLLDLILN